MLELVARDVTTDERAASVTCRRVVVAGARRLTREGIRALLGGAEGIAVVATAAEPVAVRAMIAAGEADTVVTHAYLGEPGGGAELAATLRLEAPDVGVVLLLGDGTGDHGEVRAVLDEGTQGRALLLMDHPRCAEDLPRAVHEVAEGGSIVHPGVVDLILRADRGGVDPTADLTPRERQVLTLIATGASNQAIADQLGSSHRAVEKHINQLYGKLGLPVDPCVHRRVAAAMRCWRDGQLHC